MAYKKVLMALDFHGDNEQIIEKGKQIVEDNQAELFLVHVIEPLAVAYSIDSLSYSNQVMAIETTVAKESQEKIDKIGTQLGVPIERRIIRKGSPAAEVHDVVKQHSIDLIVLGTHGQSGLQLLLGSTANSVLHGVSCDVLTVRIKY